MSKVQLLSEDPDAVLMWATRFGKSEEYTLRCLRFHNISVLHELRTPTDGLNEFYSDMTALFCTDPSLTKQEFTAECNINSIMDRFVKNPDDLTILNLNTRPPLQGDLTVVPNSYHEALNFVSDSKRQFMDLPAKVRARFDNDPGNFLDFLDHPDTTVDQLVELGLAVPPVMHAEASVDASLGQETGGATSSKKPVSKASKGGDSGGD